MTDKRSAGLRFALAAVLAVTLAEKSLVVPAAPASARVCDAWRVVVTATPSDRTEVLVSLPEALTRRAVPASALTVTEDGLDVPVLEFAPGSAAAIDVVVILDNSARSARVAASEREAASAPLIGLPATKSAAVVTTEGTLRSHMTSRSRPARPCRLSGDRPSRPGGRARCRGARRPTTARRATAAAARRPGGGRSGRVEQRHVDVRPVSGGPTRRCPRHDRPRQTTVAAGGRTSMSRTGGRRKCRRGRCRARRSDRRPPPSRPARPKGGVDRPRLSELQRCQ